MLVGMWAWGCFLTSILQGVFVKIKNKKQQSQLAAPTPPGAGGELVAWVDGLLGLVAPGVAGAGVTGRPLSKPAPPPGAGGTSGHSGSQGWLVSFGSLN